MQRSLYSTLVLLIIIICINHEFVDAIGVISSPTINQKPSLRKELSPKKSYDNYNHKFKFVGKAKSSSASLATPEPSIIIGGDDVGLPRSHRHRRCLVEAVLYRRGFTSDGSMRKKNRSVATHIDVIAKSQEDHTPLKRAKRSTRTARPYFTTPTDHQVALLGLPSTQIDGKIIVPIGVFAQIRPYFYTADGLKVWGAGSEFKFPPLFEFLLQRVQSYYSIYKYEDLSRPGLEWADGLRPDPKPLDVDADLETVGTEGNQVTLK